MESMQKKQAMHNRRSQSLDELRSSKFNNIFSQGIFGGTRFGPGSKFEIF